MGSKVSRSEAAMLAKLEAAFAPGSSPRGGGAAEKFHLLRYDLAENFPI